MSEQKFRRTAVLTTLFVPLDILFCKMPWKKMSYFVWIIAVFIALYTGLVKKLQFWCWRQTSLTGPRWPNWRCIGSSLGQCCLLLELILKCPIVHASNDNESTSCTRSKNIEQHNVHAGCVGNTLLQLVDPFALLTPSEMWGRQRDLIHSLDKIVFSVTVLQCVCWCANVMLFWRHTTVGL